MSKKILLHMLIAIGSLSLLACDKADEDWIEVPLSENTYFGGSSVYQEKEFDILLLNQSAREFKLSLQKGDVITYQWSVEMEQPELLASEFHGHTNRVGGEPGTVMFYRIHKEGKESGALVAPFDGIHGWYLNNESDEDITIKLRVAGFFESVD